MKKPILLLLITLLYLGGVSQVAINTTGASAAVSAILDVSSTTRGILIPRLLTAGKNAIASPANGLMVYDTETDSFWYYDGSNSGWVEIITTATSSINNLTDGKNDGTSLFIGTNTGLVDDGTSNKNTAVGNHALKTNSTGNLNTSIGYEALIFNTSGAENTSNGAYSLYYNTIGNLNTAIGARANLYNVEGGYNTIIGADAGRGSAPHNKSGNIFLGYQAGYNETGDNKLYIENSSSTTPLIGGDFENDSIFLNGVVRITGGTPGSNKILTSDEDGNATWESNAAATDINGLSDGKSDWSSVFLGNNAGTYDDGTNLNTGIGVNALRNTTSGGKNTATGTYSMYYNTNGGYNTAIGYYSLFSNISSSYNCAIGYYTLSDNTGEKNTALGTYAAGHNSTGSNNVTLGYASNYNNQTGANNTIIGYQAGRGSALHDKSGNIFLGYQAGYNETGDNKLYIENSSSSTPLIGGDFAANEVYINGTIKITGGTPGADKVLTSDASGNATWEASQVGVTEINDLSDGKSYFTNLFLGTNAGLNANGSSQSNTAIGIDALRDITYGNYNTATGAYALRGNTTGDHNTATGTSALYYNTSGRRNTAIGDIALFDNISGHYNTAIGDALVDNISGSNNTAIGRDALSHNTTGSNNVGVGNSANMNNQEGSFNTIVGYLAGGGSTLHNKSNNIFLGYRAGYNETGSDKLYIENSGSSTPLIGGDFDADEVYFNTLKLGIGTSNPRELLEVASSTDSYGRMIVSDGGGDERNVILFVSPTASNQTARIEAYKYGTGVGGLTLNFNTVGNGNSIFGGNVLPESHISKNLGASGQAWNNVYAHNYVTQGSAAFADVKVTQQLIDFPPKEKQSGAFDEFTEKGLKELDPSSLPESLKENNAILIDEMTTYNYKANYEQQLQIEELKNNKSLKKQIDFLTIENNNLKNRLERLESLVNSK